LNKKEEVLQIKLQVSFSEILSLPADEPDEIYPYAPDSDQQFAELCLPEKKTNVPVVMLIHGGCWESVFDLKHAHAMCTTIRNAGMAELSRGLSL